MDLSVIGKLFGEFKAKLRDINIGFNQTKSNITIHDNSTNNHYEVHVHVSEKLGQLPENVQEKIKEGTIANIKKAFEEKPEEIKPLMEKDSSLALANTVTIGNIPWLYGATTVEPITPMPSGDFIEKLSEAVQTISGDTIGISEDVNIKIVDENKDHSLIKEIKMNQEQTYNNCENYNTPECPHIDDELMKNLSAGMNINDEEGNNPFSTTEEVNKKYCNPCTSFKDSRG